MTSVSIVLSNSLTLVSSFELGISLPDSSQAESGHKDTLIPETETATETDKQGIIDLGFRSLL